MPVVVARKPEFNINDVESLKEFLQAQAVNASVFFADLFLAHVGIKSPQTQATDHEGRFTVDERDRVKKARWKQVVIPAHYLDLYFNRFHPFLPSRALTCSFCLSRLRPFPFHIFSHARRRSTAMSGMQTENTGKEARRIQRILMQLLHRREGPGKRCDSVKLCANHFKPETRR